MAPEVPGFSTYRKRRCFLLYWKDKNLRRRDCLTRSFVGATKIFKSYCLSISVVQCFPLALFIPPCLRYPYCTPSRQIIDFWVCFSIHFQPMRPLQNLQNLIPEKSSIHILHISKCFWLTSTPRQSPIFSP